MITKMFQHKGERTPETDAIAEEIARHALGDAAEDVQLTWTKHHQPDIWLLFASGEELQ